MHWITLPLGATLLAGCAGYESCETWNALQDDASVQTCAAAIEVNNPAWDPVPFVTQSGEAIELAPPHPQDRRPDGMRLVGQPWGLTVFDAGRTIVERDSVGEVSGVAVSSDGVRTVLGLGDGRVLFREGEITIERRVAPDRVDFPGMEVPNTARWLAFSPDGTRLATGEQSGRVTVWNAVDGSRLWSAKPGKGVPHVAFSPNGQFLATGSTDKALRLWDAATGAALHTWTHPRFVTGVGFAPDGRHVAVWLSESYTPRTSTQDRRGGTRVSGGTTQPAIAVLWRLP